jgi:predicted N-acetyltransferase YhbS
MALKVRAATSADAGECGRIIYEAFKALNEGHGFPPDFPSAEAATGLVEAFLANPTITRFVAEADGRIAGSNFLRRGHPIDGLGPISVDPSMQGQGIGRRLMSAAVEEAKNSQGVRLVQDAFNTVSTSLYASLGFAVREPLLLMSGRPRIEGPSRLDIRPMTELDVSACDALCRKVLGLARTDEIREALAHFGPQAGWREGRIVAYMTAPTFWIANHGVALTDDDLKDLIAGVGQMVSGPVSFLAPTRRAPLFRWCLEAGMRAVKPMNLMTLGQYEEPSGAYFPSVLY